ncbi:hypothetical protein BH09PLA1_BH09PLA1_27030 [soil metagenome]
MLCGWVIWMTLVATSPAADIARVPATARRVVFDPEHASANVPKLNPGESAVTESRFDCRAEFTCQVISESPREGQIEVNLKLTGATIRLAMESRIYLPTSVRAPLRVHEEGHRVINERIYEQDASRIAAEVAQRAMDRTWTARGDDAESAMGRALVSAEAEIHDEFRRAIVQRVAEVSDAYDALTRHGANELLVVDAIEQAFQSVAISGRIPPPAPREAPSP